MEGGSLWQLVLPNQIDIIMWGALKATVDCSASALGEEAPTSKLLEKACVKGCTHMQVPQSRERPDSTGSTE